MFYLFKQNNSYGYFDVDDKVCHRLVIEAENEHDATLKAEELGCYWDGVVNGIDCPCCGDRWSGIDYLPDIHRVRVYVYDGYKRDTVREWDKKYRRYGVVEEPKWIDIWGVRKYSGAVDFGGIEEYMQYLANEYGWTNPDARIYYSNGNVKEIFTKV